MDKMNRAILFFVLFMIMLPGAADSRVSELDQGVLKSALEAAAKAEGTKLGEYTLVDQDGVRFSLSEYFDGKKPLIISYIYTSCPVVCPTITAEFTKVVDGAPDAFGDRFNVLTIGFDSSNDTPERLREYAGRFSGGPRFRYASSDEATLERLLNSVGFFG
jgi:protein SCO1/2